MKPFSALLSKFKQIRRDTIQLKNDAPRIYGVIAVREIRKNFDRESFFGKQKWKRRSPATNKAYDKRRGVKGSVYNSKNKLLRQTGNYYNSIHYEQLGNKVSIGVNQKLVPYAKIHNEGLTGLAWGKHSFRMPKRQAIGYDISIATQVKKEMRERTRKIFRGL
jgi:phage gpG-like protein